jgi:hypothetical protein
VAKSSNAGIRTLAGSALVSTVAMITGLAARAAAPTLPKTAGNW